MKHVKKNILLFFKERKKNRKYEKNLPTGRFEY